MVCPAFKTIIKYLAEITPSQNFLLPAIGFEAVLIGVAIPVSLQVVLWVSKEYKDTEIAKMFIKEKIYLLQYVSLLFNIVISLLLILMDIKNPLLLLALYIWVIINVILFWLFMKKIHFYSTNTLQLILNKLKKFVNENF